MKKLTVLVLAHVLAVLMYSGPAHAQDFTFTEEADGIKLSENGKPVYFYQRKTKSLNGAFPRANYLHPLYGLGGEILTEDFPEDHLHHRGIYWAWHQLLINGEKVADPWECKGIEWRVNNVHKNSTGSEAVLQVEVDWIVPLNGAEVPVIKENTTITTQAMRAGRRIVDFAINLTAIEHDVSIGGSEDAKGYSGFSARLQLPADVRFLSEKGEIAPEETAVKAGGWIDMVANFGDKPSGVIIMADVGASPEHGWILRRTGSMQNAAWPGREAVTIRAGQTLKLRYRLVIHEGVLSASTTNDIYQDFVKK